MRNHDHMCPKCGRWFNQLRECDVCDPHGSPAATGSEAFAATFTAEQASLMWHLLDATVLAQSNRRYFTIFKHLRDKFPAPPNNKVSEPPHP